MFNALFDFKNYNFISVIEIILIVVFIFALIIYICINENRKLVDKVKKVSMRNETYQRRLKEIEAKREFFAKKNNYHLSHLNSVFMTMRDGIIVFDKHFRIKLANPKAMEMLNLDNLIFFDENIAENNAKIREILKLIEKADDEEIIVREAKDKYLQYQVSKIRDKYQSNDDLGLLLVITDISETEVNNRLRNEFIENISHEFKTPMTILLGYVETLKLWDDLDESIIKRSLSIIEYETAKLNKMVDQLLSLTKVNGQLKLELKEIDIVKTINDMIEEYRTYFIDKNLDFKIESESSKIIINVNELSVSNALSNIIENAMKYTKDMDIIKISIFKDEVNCYVTIKDHGPGIAKEHIERIFERFYRIEKDRNSKTGGTGLGLPIAKDSIERIGGELNIESSINVGTTFTITLPLNYEKQNI